MNKMTNNWTKILFFIAISSFGQTLPPDYYFHRQQADSLWQLSEYKKSGFAFSAAFMTLGNKGLVEDRYRAARVWSLANIPDSAFDCLNRIVLKKYFTDYDRLINEKDFLNLQSDKRWQTLIDNLKNNRTTQNKSPWVKVTILVKNKEKFPVSLYWVDHNNHEIFYFDLKPNEERYQETFMGHVWVFRNKENRSQVLEFMVTKQNQIFDTKAKYLDTFDYPDKKIIEKYTTDTLFRHK